MNVLKRILNYIYGYYEVEADNCKSVLLLNFMMKHRIPYYRLNKDCDGTVSFNILKKDSDILLRFVSENEENIVIKAKHGLLNSLGRYKLRAGIAVGVTLFFLLLWQSGGYIWRMEVSGNDLVPAKKILSELELLGCGVGSKISDIDFFELCNDYIALSDEISWISVNLKGTVANVEVIEQKNTPKKSEEKPSNIVAVRAGQIDSIRLYSGMCAVKIGDVVNKGELLISGFEENRHGVASIMRASGEIIAYTTRMIEVKIPYKTQEKVYTGKYTDQKSLNIFGKIIKLYKNTGNYDIMYDKIENRSSIVLFDKIQLPISVLTARYNEYRYDEITLSEAEAEAEAMAQLKKRISDELRNAEIVNIEISVTSALTNPEAEEYNILCIAHCLENIAEEKYIEIEN